MRWSRGRGMDQIEDRRGQGGFGGGLPMGRVGGGMGIIGLLLALFLGGGNILGGGGGGGGGGFGIDPGVGGFSGTETARGGDGLDGAPDPDADLKQFVGFVVDDVQTEWQELFAASGKRYEQTTLVLFEDGVSTGCGSASSATGPFYCPADRKVYLDLGFFRELSTRFGAPGDFAQAYVIAHEFGHHVQTVIGVERRVRAAQQENPDDANELSVRMELQADCFAGVWAHSAYEDQLLESGDLEEGIEAAEAVGDDRIQRQSGGRVNPETWTHGSSKQRQQWFRKGFDSGDPEVCDTFAS